LPTPVDSRPGCRPSSRGWGVSQMNEQSTLAHMMPPLMKLMRRMSLLPGSLPRFITNRLSQKAEITLPAIKANTTYFKIMKEGWDGKRKVVVHPFNFPPEILHALGVAPVFIEFVSTLAAGAPEKYPDNIFRYLKFIALKISMVMLYILCNQINLHCYVSFTNFLILFKLTQIHEM